MLSGYRCPPPWRPNGWLAPQCARDSPKRWIQDQPERRRWVRQADGLPRGSANRCPFGAWISDGGSPAKCSRRPIRYRRIRGTRHTRSCAALRAPRRVLQRCRTIRSASGPPAREPGWRAIRSRLPRHQKRTRLGRRHATRRAKPRTAPIEAIQVSGRSPQYAAEKLPVPERAHGLLDHHSRQPPPSRFDESGTIIEDGRRDIDALNAQRDGRRRQRASA